MLVFDAKKLTLTQSITIDSNYVTNAWEYYRNFVMDALDGGEYPDYQESLTEALDYSLDDFDIASILEYAKDAYDDDLNCCIQSYSSIDDPDLISDAVAEWCDQNFQLDGVLL